MLVPFARRYLRTLSMLVGRLPLAGLRAFADRITNRYPHLSWARLRLVAIAVTILLALLVQYLPQHVKLLHPSVNYQSVLAADNRPDNGSHATWLDDYSHSRFKCSIGTGESDWCGYVVQWPEIKGSLLDFSGYHSLRIKLKYVGAARKIRVYMRIYHPDYGSLVDANKNKFQVVHVDVNEFENAVVIPFNEFVVADWWVRSANISRQYVAPNFDSVQSMAIDFPQPNIAGEHVMDVQSIELVGDYVTKETAYFSLFFFWLFVSCCEALYLFYKLNVRAEKAQQKALTLANYARELKAETSLYKKLSGIDPLTGAYNRSGLKPFTDKSFSRDRRDRSGVLMVMDIDHFKDVNDTYGHSVGDNVIKRIAHTISGSIRAGDIFARWGGEEFVLICASVDRQTGLLIGEKVRRAVEDLDFMDGEHFQVTVSVGLTEIMPSDSFESAFNRADQALYKAKRSGRNRVAFASHLKDLAESY